MNTPPHPIKVGYFRIEPFGEASRIKACLLYTSNGGPGFDVDVDDWDDVNVDIVL